MKTSFNSKLQSHLRSLFPELLELSFGCEIRPIDVKDTDHYFAVKRWSSNDSLDTYCGEDDENYNLYDGEYIIIGHPVQLSHVLRALPTGIDVSLDTVDIDGTGNTLYINDEPIPLTLPVAEWPEDVCRELLDIMK